MNQIEAPMVEKPSKSLEPPEAVAPAPVRDQFGALARFIDRSGTGDRAALARMNPDEPLPHQVAALSRALIAAGLTPETWTPPSWKRWGLIAHGMALAGHDRQGAFGEQMARAGVSEPRVTRLLTSRGDGLLQVVAPLLRLMASKGTKPNWNELGRLVLKEGSEKPGDAADAEAVRLGIAGRYFSTLARSSKP